MNKPEYECAELFQRCLHEGMIVVALESKAEIGSPKYIIMSGLVLVPDVILLEKSDDVCSHISAPKPDNKPPSLNPTAESTVVPMANPPATPPATISSLTMFFNYGFDMSHDTTGAPNVLDCMIPYGLLSSFLYFFDCQRNTAPKTMTDHCIDFMVTSIISICTPTSFSFKVSSNGNFKSSTWSCGKSFVPAINNLL